MTMVKNPLSLAIQDPLLDRYPTHVQYHPHCYDAIETLINDFDLVDIW